MRNNPEDNLYFLRHHIKNAICTTYKTRNGSNLFIYPDGITAIGANQIMAFNYHRSKTNIEQYFMSRHKIQLSYPDFSCLIMLGGNDHRYYFPIELLGIDKTIEHNYSSDYVLD